MPADIPARPVDEDLHALGLALYFFPGSQLFFWNGPFEPITGLSRRGDGLFILK